MAKSLKIFVLIIFLIPVSSRADIKEIFPILFTEIYFCGGSGLCALAYFLEDYGTIKKAEYASENFISKYSKLHNRINGKETSNAAVFVIEPIEKDNKDHGIYVSAIAEATAKTFSSNELPIHHIIRSISPYELMNNSIKWPFHKEIELEFLDLTKSNFQKILSAHQYSVISNSSRSHDEFLSSSSILENRLKVLSSHIGNASIISAAGNLANTGIAHNALNIYRNNINIGAGIKYGGKYYLSPQSNHSSTFIAPIAPEGAILPKFYYREMRGTSAAAPYVASIIASLLQIFGDKLTPQDIILALRETADPISYKNTPISYHLFSSGHRISDEAGPGLINAEAAYQLLKERYEYIKSHNIYLKSRENTSYEVSPDLHLPSRGGFFEYRIEVNKALWCDIIMLEFQGKKANIYLTSPKGDRIKLQASKGINGYYFARADEFFKVAMKGSWMIESTAPLERIKMHFYHAMPEGQINLLDTMQAATIKSN